MLVVTLAGPAAQLRLVRASEGDLVADLWLANYRLQPSLAPDRFLNAGLSRAELTTRRDRVAAGMNGTEDDLRDAQVFAKAVSATSAEFGAYLAEAWQQAWISVEDEREWAVIGLVARAFLSDRRLTSEQIRGLVGTG